MEDTTEEDCGQSLPLKTMVVIGICIFCEPLSMTLMFPFLFFMIRDFKDVDPTALGLYCGLITAAFSFGQAITSIFWGYLSDRYGRRPILLIGLLGHAISIVAFGLSKSTLMACFSRILCGMLNGNVGVAKSVLAEITTSQTRPISFTLLGLMWAMGMVIGPVIGGFLADPSSKFPLFRNSSFFIRFPYVLPCFLVASVSLIGLLLGWLYLEETAPHIGLNQFQLAIDEAPLEQEHWGDQGHIQFEPVDPAISSFNVRNQLSVRDIWTTFSKNQSFRSSNTEENEEIFDAISQGVLDDISNPSNSQSILANDDGPISQQDDPVGRSAYKTIFAYSILHFQNTVFDEIFSLWAVAPLGTGLAFSSDDYALVLAIVGLLAFSLSFLYPILSKQIGYLPLYRGSVPFYMAVWPLLVLLTLSHLEKRFEICALIAILTLRRMINLLAFTSTNLLLVLNAKRGQLGLVNGLAVTLASIARGIAPILAGSIFSFYGYQYGFLFLLLISFGIVIQSWWMDSAEKDSSTEEEREQLLPNNNARSTET